MNQKILKYFYIHISLIIFNYQLILAKGLTIFLWIYLKIKIKHIIYIIIQKLVKKRIFYHLYCYSCWIVYKTHHANIPEGWPTAEDPTASFQCIAIDADALVHCRDRVVVVICHDATVLYHVVAVANYVISHCSNQALLIFSLHRHRMTNLTVEDERTNR